MRQILCKFWAVLGVAIVALALGACGPSDVCTTNEDCPEAGQICDATTNQCILGFVECFGEADCEPYQMCQDMVCVDRDSCEDSSQCRASQTCVNEECIPRQCNGDSDCFQGWVCDNGLCETQARQCASVGEACEIGAPTRDGFGCEDFGAGAQCYRSCLKGRGTSTVGPPTYQCARGTICTQGQSEEPVCRTQECGGYFSADEDCADAVALTPERFENGAMCTLIGNGAFVCEGAGEGEEGDSCSVTTDCARGFVCLNDLGAQGDLGGDAYCTQACESDDMCDGDQVCVGAAQGAEDGVGICGERCDPYVFTDGQCGEETSCLPLTTDDGICLRERDTEELRDYYELCEASEQCPDNSDCLSVSDDVSQRRCLPLCNTSLTTQGARDSTCPQSAAGGFVQFVNLTAGATALEVFLNGEAAVTLEAGESASRFATPAEGPMQVLVRRSGETDALVLETLTVGAQEALTVAVTPGAGQGDTVRLIQSWLPRDVEAAAHESTLRFVHGIVGEAAIDVAVVTANGDVTEAADRLLFVENMGFEAAGSFEVVGLGGVSDPVDIYVLEAGDVSGTPLLVETVTLIGGEVVSFYVVGDAAGQDSPQLVAAEYASAPEGRTLGSFCMAHDTGTGITGVCLEQCSNSDVLAAGNCTVETDTCQLTGDELGYALCYPGGEVEQGGSCEVDRDCGDSLFCDGGTCRSFCQPFEQTNDEIGCETGEACIPLNGFDNFGQCRVPCNPGSDFTDAQSCPAGQQSCYGDPGYEFCQPSGDLALHQACGDAAIQNCAPGLVCAQPGDNLTTAIWNAFGDLGMSAEGTCQQLCNPFSGDPALSGCSEGYACAPTTPGSTALFFEQSSDLGALVGLWGPREGRHVGHCVERIKTPIPSLLNCLNTDIGKMCGENSYCVDGSSNIPGIEPRGQCLQFCDFATGMGCTDGLDCVQGFTGGPLLGVYGLCT